MSEDKKDFVVKDKRRLAESEPDGKPEGGPAPSSTKNDAPADADAGGAPRQPAETHLPKIDFATFVFSLNSAVLVHLGLIEDPASGQPAKNLPLAKQTIDILGMLEEKTRGNLDSDEENLLKNILYDLRIRYVRETR
jgi:hypothetical protein